MEELRGLLMFAVQSLREHDPESKLAEVLERSLDDSLLQAWVRKKPRSAGLRPMNSLGPE